MAQRALEKELDKGQTFEAPDTNMLYETTDSSRMQSTYIADRVAGVPRVGNPTFIAASERPKRPTTLEDSLLDELGAVLGMLDNDFVTPAPSTETVGPNSSMSIATLSRSPSQTQTGTSPIENGTRVSSPLLMSDGGAQRAPSPLLAPSASSGGLSTSISAALLPSSSPTILGGQYGEKTAGNHGFSYEIPRVSAASGITDNINHTSSGDIGGSAMAMMDSLGNLAGESAGSRYTTMARYQPGGSAYSGSALPMPTASSTNNFGDGSATSTSSGYGRSANPAGGGGYGSSSIGGGGYGSSSGLGGTGGIAGSTPSFTAGYGGGGSAGGGYGGTGASSGYGGYGTTTAQNAGPSSRFSRLASFGMGMGGGSGTTSGSSSGGYGTPAATTGVGFGRHKV